MKERSFMLIKPDAMALRDEAMERLAEAGLQFERTADLQFDEQQTEALYPSRMGGEFEQRIKDYMTVGPSHVIYVTGEDAIEKVREVKGKTWSGRGLRGKYATHFVENCFHSPDSQEELEAHERIFQQTEVVVFDSNST